MNISRAAIFIIDFIVVVCHSLKWVIEILLWSIPFTLLIYPEMQGTNQPSQSFSLCFHKLLKVLHTDLLNLCLLMFGELGSSPICLYFMCMSICPVCICFHHVLTFCSGQKRPCGIGGIDGCEPPCRCWEPNLDSLQEQQGLILFWSILQLSPNKHCFAALWVCSLTGAGCWCPRDPQFECWTHHGHVMAQHCLTRHPVFVLSLPFWICALWLCWLYDLVALCGMTFWNLSWGGVEVLKVVFKTFPVWENIYLFYLLLIANFDWLCKFLFLLISVLSYKIGLLSSLSVPLIPNLAVLQP